MRAVVTGAGGFIGSTLSDLLLELGWEIRGLDAFLDYYPEVDKQRNVERSMSRPNFTLFERDLVCDDIEDVIRGVDIVFHLAGQPGVRGSWRRGFRSYIENNIAATQRLVDSVDGPSLRRFIYASSSSVYGNVPRYPATEDMLPRPYSPYGVTKLACEHLINAYAANFGLPAVSLRLFSVYGPRQRPDMAIHRLIESALAGKTFLMYGGGQSRDLTHVDDVARAFHAAAVQDVDFGSVFNVAGGSIVRLEDLVLEVERVVGTGLRVEKRDSSPGDVQRTWGDTQLTAQRLGWSPEVSVGEGISTQVEWHRRGRGR